MEIILNFWGPQSKIGWEPLAQRVNVIKRDDAIKHQFYITMWIDAIKGDAFNRNKAQWKVERERERGTNCVRVSMCVCLREGKGERERCTSDRDLTNCRAEAKKSSKNARSLIKLFFNSQRKTSSETSSNTSFLIFWCLFYMTKLRTTQWGFFTRSSF